MSSGKVKLKEKATKGEKHRSIILSNGTKHNVPESVITGYDPNSLIIEIESWFCAKKGIPCKLK